MNTRALTSERRGAYGPSHIGNGIPPVIRRRTRARASSERVFSCSDVTNGRARWASKEGLHLRGGMPLDASGHQLNGINCGRLESEGAGT